MADTIQELEYEKVWTDKNDFPTYEPEEAQVRADFQYHPDVIRDYINHVLVPALAALGKDKMATDVYDPQGKGTDVYDFAQAIAPFIAVYGVTLVADIESAHQGGKAIVLKLDDGATHTAHAARISETEWAFYAVTPDSIRRLTCGASGWGEETYLFNPKLHGEEHYTDGTDPIKPHNIGAAEMGEVIRKGVNEEYTPTDPYDPVTKAYVDSLAAAFTLGQIADGSLTLEKLAFSPAVTDEKGKMLDEHIPDAVALKSATAEVVLLASGWVGSSAPYTQTVACSIVSAGANGVVGVADSANGDARGAARDALLQKTAQADGSLTVTADGVKPDVDIPIQVLVVS